MDIKVMSSISVLDKDVLYIKTENGMKNGRDFTNFGIPLQQIYLFSNKWVLCKVLVNQSVLITGYDKFNSLVHCAFRSAVSVAAEVLNPLELNYAEL